MKIPLHRRVKIFHESWIGIKLTNSFERKQQKTRCCLGAILQVSLIINRQKDGSRYKWEPGKGRTKQNTSTNLDNSYEWHYMTLGGLITQMGDPIIMTDYEKY